MPDLPVSVTLTYPDGASVSFEGEGAVVYTADDHDQRLFAITGRLTLGDAAQLMTELMDAFGEEDIILAASIALVARRMDESGAE